MTEHIVNTTLAFVKFDQKGEDKKGNEWQRYSIKVSDSNWKDVFISYFYRGKDNPPVQGMKIKHMELEEKEYQGKTSWNIKKIEFFPQPKETKQQASGEAKQAAGSTFDNTSMFVSYVKDLVIALQERGASPSESLGWLEEAVPEIVKWGVWMKFMSDHPVKLKEYLDKKEADMLSQPPEKKEGKPDE